MKGNFEFLIFNFELGVCAARTGISLHPFQLGGVSGFRQARAQRAPQFKIHNSQFTIQG
jgi:hypothetical protein